jgi:hypothetical protein
MIFSKFLLTTYLINDRLCSEFYTLRPNHTIGLTSNNFLSDLKWINMLISIALKMFYEKERFPNMSLEEREHVTSAYWWMQCFNIAQMRKAEAFLANPQQTAWNPAWKPHKKKKNKRK